MTFEIVKMLMWALRQDDFIASGGVCGIIDRENLASATPTYNIHIYDFNNGTSAFCGITTCGDNVNVWTL